MQKPLGDMASYIKKLIPANIPEFYTVKPMFEGISTEYNIRNGVIAFRDFMYLICDRLITDSDLYDKPPKSVKNDASHHVSLPVCYPFINNVKDVLFNIGYSGILAEKRDSLLVDDWQSLTPAIAMNGQPFSGKISAPKLFEALKFLACCGLCFDGIDLAAEKLDKSRIDSIEISYPDNPVMLTGLKAMAIAQRELYTKGNNDIFLRCDYRVLKDEATDITSILEDFVEPLPSELRDFALKINKRYLESGLICKIDISFLNIRFIYFYKNKEIGTISSSLDSAYRLIIRAQSTHLYPDVIETFPVPLQDTIARGYGCDKKRFGQPCQKSCHGFSLPLDESILKIGRYIEMWMDKELACLLGQ